MVVQRRIHAPATEITPSVVVCKAHEEAGEIIVAVGGAVEAAVGL